MVHTREMTGLFEFVSTQATSTIALSEAWKRVDSRVRHRREWEARVLASFRSFASMADEIRRDLDPGVFQGAMLVRVVRHASFRDLKRTFSAVFVSARNWTDASPEGRLEPEVLQSLEKFGQWLAESERQANAFMAKVGQSIADSGEDLHAMNEEWSVTDDDAGKVVEP